MALETFSVTHSDVRAHYFPNLAAFAAGTKPTSTAVGVMIDEASAELMGRLLSKGVVADTINDSTNYPAAFNWCAGYIRLASAVKVVHATIGAGKVPELWATELKMKQESLEKYGYVILGDAPAPAQEANGPISHISNHSLDVGEDTDISDAVPRFRRSDVL